MSIKAEFKNFNDFIDFSSGQIIIPDFQRGYSWERGHVEKLWSDITENSADGSYFIGSIIYYKVSNKDYYITDGQQRLTTIFIFLSALRDAFSKLGAGEATDISRYFTSYVSAGKAGNKFINSNADRDSQNLIGEILSFEILSKHSLSPSSDAVPENFSDEFRRLYEAKKFFDNAIRDFVKKEDRDEYTSLKTLYDYVMELGIVDIKLVDKNEAFRIFNTLNSRGLNLRSSDLIKNHIYSIIPQVEQDRFISDWEVIEKNINSINRVNSQIDLDLFLYHEWFSLGNRTSKISKKQIHEYYEGWIIRENAQDLVQKIKFDSFLYRFIFIPSFDLKDESGNFIFKEVRRYKQIQERLEFYNLMNISRSAPALLSLIRYATDSSSKNKFSDILNAIKYITNFHFHFDAVGSVQNWKIDKNAFNAFAKSVYQNPQYLKGHLEYLWHRTARIPDLSESNFIGNFHRVNYASNKNLVLFVLEKMDAKLCLVRPSYEGAPTIEHLLPRESSRYPGSYVDWPGNLLVMGDALNRELGNKNPIEKMNELKTKNYQLLPEMMYAQKWGEEEIVSNTKIIAKRVYDEVFPLHYK